MPLSCISLLSLLIEIIFQNDGILHFYFFDFLSRVFHIFSSSQTVLLRNNNMHIYHKFKSAKLYQALHFGMSHFCPNYKTYMPKAFFSCCLHASLCYSLGSNLDRCIHHDLYIHKDWLIHCLFSTYQDKKLMSHLTNFPMFS